jgi:branched-chain amino acid transport system permease protein
MLKKYLSWAYLVAIAAAAIILPLLFKKPFEKHVLILILMYSILGSAWNVLGGYTGQVSLGHAVFFGIGAYTSSVMLIKWGITPWVGLLVGGVISSIVSVFIGLPTFKLRGFYFAIATIALGEMVRTLFLNWEWVGGAVGLELPIKRGDKLINMQFYLSKNNYYYILLGIFALTLLAIYLMQRSKLGYYFRAVKDSHEAALASGIDTTQTKLVAMAISAFITSVVGSIYAQYLLYIDPYVVFASAISVRVCLVAILGGEGRLTGPVIGSVILVILSEYSRALLGGGGKGVDLIIYGTLIVLVAAFQPRGILGMLDSIKSKRQRAVTRNA